uniref:Uncharacterized protein n=1 Tax=Hanusia phi TaxID=3032 RepID=A0A7S0HAU4_9CRYP|mmetsp:Transcript_17859/g.40465  ORF Transcript_17859/g.40465 Transcript_17859/m.40465 type:complete len:352 (+) Transcript_17859:1079-2134(+)
MSRAQTPRTYTPRQWTGDVHISARDLSEASGSLNILRSQSVQSGASAASSSLKLNVRGMNLFNGNQAVLLQRAIAHYTPRISARRSRDGSKPIEEESKKSEGDEETCNKELDTVYASLSRERSPEAKGEEEHGVDPVLAVPLPASDAHAHAAEPHSAGISSCQANDIDSSGGTSEVQQDACYAVDEAKEKPMKGGHLGHLREFPRPMRGVAGSTALKKQGTESKWGLGVGGRGLEPSTTHSVSLKGGTSYSSPLGENIRLVFRKKMPDLLQLDRSRAGQRPSSAESKRTIQVPRIKRSRSQCAHMKESTNTIHERGASPDSKLEAQGGRKSIKELYQRPKVKLLQPALPAT